MSIQSQEYSKRLYIAEEVKSVYEGVTSRNYYDVCSVECEEVEEGFVLPLKKSIDDSGTSYFRGGVTDSRGVFVEMSRHWRGSKGGSLTEGYDFSLKDAEIVPKEVLYGGIFVNHFGHFLMESTNRLWYLIENKEKNLDIVFLNAKRQKVIPQFWEFMDLLGISREKVHFISQPTRFSKVYVPGESHIINHSFNKKFLHPFRYAADQVTAQPSEKIYLSRTKFRGGTLCLGEAYIEDVFRKNGFKILHPESMSLREQIAYLKGAKTVAGVIGTATHMEVFARQGVKSIILERSDTPIEEQALIHQAIEAEWYCIGTNMNPFPIEHSAGPALLGVTDNLAQFGRAHGLQVDEGKIGYVKKSDGKTFIKEYLKLYTQESYNRRLAKTAPLTAERLLKIAASFIPWRKKLKQFFKAKSYPSDVSVIFVSVVRDYDMYDKCVGQNKFCRNVQLNPIDNRVENKGISQRYNEFLDDYEYSREAWFVFCHEDWQILEEPEKKLQGLDKNCLYGCIGVRYEESTPNDLIHPVGPIVQCDKTGKNRIVVGRQVCIGGEFADTVDCQCLIVHSSLIQRHKLRFDENLTFDFYVEEFCINASERYDVKLKVIPLKCVHYSGGNITERFYNSVKYVQEKYKTISKCYASTVAHTVIGRDKSTKKIKTARHFDWRTFLFQKKITNSGKLLIKICKIPVVSKKILIRKIPDLGECRGVIYTCISGDYDRLIEHTYTDSEFKYVCFTDNKNLLRREVVGLWKIYPLYFDELDRTKNARWHKTHPHVLFPKVSESIWIDANGDILSSYLFDIIKEKNSSLLVPYHFSRDDIYDECEEVLKCKKDTLKNCNSVLSFLKKEGMPRHYGLNETNVIYRKHTESSIINLMESWWNCIRDISKRDQLSFSYVLWKNGIPVKDISIPNARFNKGNFLFETHKSQAKKSHKTVRFLGLRIKIKVGR